MPDDVLAKLLKRPADERARVARALLESLDEADDRDAVEAQQAAEIARRVQAVQNGEPTVSYEEVRDRIRARLDSLRASDK